MQSAMFVELNWNWNGCVYVTIHCSTFVCGYPPSVELQPSLPSLSSSLLQLWFWTMDVKTFQKGVLSGAADSKGGVQGLDFAPFKTNNNCFLSCVCVQWSMYVCALSYLAVKHYTLGKKLTVVTRKDYVILLNVQIGIRLCLHIVTDAGLGEVFSCDTSCLNQDSAKGTSSSQRMLSVRAVSFY